MCAGQRSSEQPPPDPLFALGMAVFTWLVLAFAALAFWPGQRAPQRIADMPPAPAQLHHAEMTEMTEPGLPSYIVAPEPGSRAKRAVRQTGKVKAKRPRGPSIAARVFAVTTN
jgi:hypothetical protein